MNRWLCHHLKLKTKMAQMNFGGVTENVVTREEFPLENSSTAIFFCSLVSA